VARRLALAVGAALPAKMGLPLGSVVTEVRVMGALAKVGLVVADLGEWGEWQEPGGGVEGPGYPYGAAGCRGERGLGSGREEGGTEDG
jgi:hypothetical protein